MLDEAQTLVDRATRSLHGKASPKSLGDQEEAP